MIDFAGTIAKLQRIEKMSKTPGLKDGQKFMLYMAIVRIGSDLAGTASTEANRISDAAVKNVLGEK